MRWIPRCGLEIFSLWQPQDFLTHFSTHCHAIKRQWVRGGVRHRQWAQVPGAADPEEEDDQDENGGDGGEGREAGASERREGNSSFEEGGTQRLQREPARGASNTRVRFPKDTYFATCHPGLEPALASELRGLPGVLEVTEGRAGVNFLGSKGIETRYRANLELRSAIRVLELVAECQLELDGNGRGGGDSVYDAIRKIDWRKYIPRGCTFKVKAVVWDNSEVTSSLLVSIRTRDAVCDCLRDDAGWRPEDPRDSAPDVPLGWSCTWIP